MAYDVHIVRTENWLDAAGAPITKADAEAIVASDSELAWSTEDWVDLHNESGEVIRYYAILWKGEPAFLWQRHEITCSGPDDKHMVKLVQIARALGALAVGDDGERYELRRTLFGKEKLVTIRA
jgi:hypothetical protein